MSKFNGNVEDSIDGLERSLPESCVEYMLFLIEFLEDHSTTLDAVKKAALRLAGELTADYIWQRDSFNLEAKSQGGMKKLKHYPSFYRSL